MIKTKGKLKTKRCVLVDYSYYPKFFNILAIAGQNYFSFYPLSLFRNNIASYIASQLARIYFFHGKQFLS